MFPPSRFLLVLLVVVCASSVIRAHDNGGSDAATDNHKVVELSDDTFTRSVLESNQIWFVNFYAPWCTHCQRLDETWRLFSLRVNASVHVAKLDATAHIYNAKRFDVRGFPTLKLFVPGGVYDYGGDRRLEQLLAFVDQGHHATKLAHIPKPPNNFQLYLEYFIQLSADVQLIVLRTPTSAASFVSLGMLFGALLTTLLLTLCAAGPPKQYTTQNGEILNLTPLNTQRKLVLENNNSKEDDSKHEGGDETPQNKKQK